MGRQPGSAALPVRKGEPAALEGVPDGLVHVTQVEGMGPEGIVLQDAEEGEGEGIKAGNEVDQPGDSGGRPSRYRFLGWRRLLPETFPAYPTDGLRQVSPR